MALGYSKFSTAQPLLAANSDTKPSGGSTRPRFDSPSRAILHRAVAFNIEELSVIFGVRQGGNSMKNSAELEAGDVFDFAKSSGRLTELQTTAGRIGQLRVFGRKGNGVFAVENSVSKCFSFMCDRGSLVRGLSLQIDCGVAKSELLVLHSCRTPSQYLELIEIGPAKVGAELEWLASQKQ